MPKGGALPPVDRTEVASAYIAHTRPALPEPERLGRFRLAIDTANGATTTVAPHLFSDLGFDVTVIGDEANGRNINLDCGSTHPEKLASLVRDGRHRMGVPFHRAADRPILV